MATRLEETHGAWRVSMVGNVLLRTPEVETTSWLKELGRIEGNILLHDNVDFDEAADLATWLETIAQRVPGFQLIPLSKIGLSRPVGPQ